MLRSTSKIYRKSYACISASFFFLSSVLCLCKGSRARSKTFVEFIQIYDTQKSPKLSIAIKHAWKLFAQSYLRPVFVRWGFFGFCCLPLVATRFAESVFFWLPCYGKLHRRKTDRQAPYSSANTPVAVLLTTHTNTSTHIQSHTQNKLYFYWKLWGAIRNGDEKVIFMEPRWVDRMQASHSLCLTMNEKWEEKSFPNL